MVIIPCLGTNFWQTGMAPLNSPVLLMKTRFLLRKSWGLSVKSSYPPIFKFLLPAYTLIYWRDYLKSPFLGGLFRPLHGSQSLYIYIYTYMRIYIYTHHYISIYPATIRGWFVYIYILLYLSIYIFYYIWCVHLIIAKRWKVGLKTCYTYPIGFLLSSDHSAAWHSFGRELGSGSPAICCCVTIAVNAPESAPQVACAATLGPAVFGELSLRRYGFYTIVMHTSMNNM